MDWKGSEDAALHVEEEPVRFVGDARPDRDEQDAGEHVVDVGLVAESVSIAPPNTYTNSSISAIGVTAVVMIVSGL